MTLKDDMIAYRERWQAVAEIELQEFRAATIETKWQQLNSIIRLAIGLGIFKVDPSEEEVHLRWATLKEKADDHQP
jgi:hypothetical protein